MTDQFSRYELDLIDLIKSSKTILSDKIPIAEKDEKRILIRQVNKAMDDMNSMLGEMEFELSKFGPNSRSSMQNKLKQYRLDIELMQKDLKRLTNESTKQRGYENPAFSNNRADPERQRVLQMHASIKNAGESIARSTQIAIETDQIGNSVLSELNEQGERLRHTNEMLDDTNMNLSKSRRLLNSLSRGVFYNKCLLVVIIILEIIALGGLIFWKFFT